MDTDSSNPRSYELEVLTIVNNEGEGFDVRDLLIECNIYESIHRNFLMGELTIVDGIGLMENAKLFGQETLRIRFKQPEASAEDDIIDQLFRIYKIQGVTRIHETTQAFQLNFCSPEFIQSRRTRISQAFRGSMTDIAAKIAEDHLDISNEEGLPRSLEPYFEVKQQSLGDNYHVVIPNWTVNYTINWLCAQAQAIGAQGNREFGGRDSFFWYQTANGGYRIQALSRMIMYDDKPFTYTEPGPEVDDTDVSYDSSFGVGRRILEYKVNSYANVLEGIVKGLFGSNQITINNTHKFYREKSYSFLEKFNLSGESITEFPFVRISPEKLYIGSSITDDAGDIITSWREETGKSIFSYPNAHRTLTSDSDYVNDINDNIHQANHNVHLGANQTRNAIRQLLQYHTISLVLPTRTDISCGQLINLDIPVPDAGEEPTDAKFYNGKHLITDIRWRLQPTTCVLNIKCMKGSVMTQIDPAIIDYGKELIE